MHLTLGTLYTYANMSTYLASYIHHFDPVFAIHYIIEHRNENCFLDLQCKYNGNSKLNLNNYSPPLCG